MGEKPVKELVRIICKGLLACIVLYALFCLGYRLGVKSLEWFPPAA